MRTPTARLAVLLMSLASAILGPPADLPAHAGTAPARLRCGGVNVLTDTPPGSVSMAGMPTRLRLMRAGRVVWVFPDTETPIAQVDCRDLTGDRTPELVVETYSGGAHCCSVVHVLSLNAQVRLLLRYATGNAGSADIADLNKDGRLELVLGDDSFAYFDDLCFACSPSGIPLVACFRAGRFEDCTRRFPGVVRAQVAHWSRVLREEAQKPNDATALMYAKGAALGLYANHVLLGEDARGWQTVRAIAPPTALEWLERHRAAVHRWAASRGKKLQQ